MNVYKNRAKFLLFGIILIINIILVSLVFIAYSSIIKSDYEEKLTSVASQTAANANLILSFFEEEIEVFINKYNVEEELDSFKLDAPDFVRVDSTSFEEVMIFNGVEPVYASNAEYVDFYREMVTTKSFVNVMENHTNRWLINEEKGKILNSHGTLIYVRTLFDTYANEKCGFVVAAVSSGQLLKLLNISTGYQTGRKGEFLPHSVGISIDDKILFLGDNLPGKEKAVLNEKELSVGKNEMYFVNCIGEKEFITMHDSKILKDKIYVVLLLFILIFVVITLSSYKILTFILNEICVRMDNLNLRIEMYTPGVEDKKL